jgi:hypothetical protein
MASTRFAAAYNDDGVFKLRYFGRETRTGAEIAKNDLNINDLLGIRPFTMAVENLPDPFITCCFISNEIVFINLFYNYSFRHYHFQYNVETSKLVGEVVDIQIGTSKKNFPVKCFYNDDEDEIYSFYRQGEALIIQPHNSKKYTINKMTEMELGTMYLIYN